MRVFKWRDSLAVCLPQAVVEALTIKEGDDVEIVAAMNHVEISHDRRRAEALERMRLLQKPLPHGFGFDRDEANSR